MIDKNLDNLKNSAENQSRDSKRSTPETLAGKEQEKSPTEKSPEKKC